MMHLATASFTPSDGSAVPYLLIDMMSMGKKRAAFVEFYDCTKAGVDAPALRALAQDYRRIPDYAEKPAWYVRERMDGSVIKGGSPAEEQALLEMTMDALARYAQAWKTASKDPANLEGLRAFADRMVSDGNPSTGTMEKILGKGGAETYFRTAVMPVEL